MRNETNVSPWREGDVFAQIYDQFHGLHLVCVINFEQYVICHAV